MFLYDLWICIFETIEALDIFALYFFGQQLHLLKQTLPFLCPLCGDAFLLN